MSQSAESGFENQVAVSDLPLTFKVKYIGNELARGLWGIKYTRRPVDIMVGAAKNLPPNKVLPHCDLTVSTNGVELHITAPKANETTWNYAIDTISYGVQDLVYTRVFAMIVVKEDKKNPFEVHAFVCDSRATARQLTFALAAAFQDYSRRVKESSDNNESTITKKKFAIDLRTPEELQECLDEETEA